MSSPIPIHPLIQRAFLTSFAALALAGCSDMRFVDAKKETEADPRENIVLTHVVADMTSGGALMHRVKSREAVYEETRKGLALTGLNVEIYDNKHRLQGETQAATGRVYLADDAKAGRLRNDFELTSDVHHRVPKTDDPTTDSIQLTTENLVWSGRTSQFLGDKPFEICIFQPGKSPIGVSGDGFRVARNLKRWVFMHGAVSTGGTSVPREEIDKRREELNRLGDQLAVGVVNQPKRGDGVIAPPRRYAAVEDGL